MKLRNYEIKYIDNFDVFKTEEISSMSDLTTVALDFSKNANCVDMISVKRLKEEKQEVYYKSIKHNTEFVYQDMNFVKVNDQHAYNKESKLFKSFNRLTIIKLKEKE